MSTGAPRPYDEDERMRQLRALAVLDTSNEPLFDGLVAAASAACATPISLITLVDEHRQWYKANHGLPGVTETPRDQGFCAHVILGSDVFEVQDASTDDRFAENPSVVGDPHIRFYAGAPIVLSGGAHVGTLCVIDRVPRALTDLQRSTIAALALTAGDALEMRLRGEDATDRMTRLYESTPAMLHAIDSDGTIVMVSDVWLQKLGYRRDEVVGRNATEFLSHESVTHAASRSETFQADDRCDDQEFRMVRKDGTPLDVLLSGIREHRVDGATRRSMAVLEDLTERRRAEAALADEQGRRANIIEGNGVGTWELDVTTGLMAVNHRYLEIVGRVPSAALIDLAAEAHLVHPEDRPRRQALLGEHLRGRSERYASQHRLRVGDHWVWVLDTACVAARNERGRPVRVHGTLMDITVNKDAEAALRSSTDSLDRTGRLAEVGGWELEVASGRLTWSDETCRIHDLPPGFQPTLEGAVSFYEHDARKTIAEAVEATMAAGTSYDLVLPLVTAVGRRIVVRTVGTVERAADGTPLRLVGAVQDVTARAALERNLAESHELLQVTLQSIADAVITTHADGTVRWLNPEAEQLTGWTSDQASGRPLMEVFTIVDESTGATMGDPVERCLVADQPLVCHAELISRSGGRPNIEGTASAIRGQDGETMGGVLVFRDVSEQRRLAREMTHRAKHDPLTGLVNRTEFEQQLISSLHDAVSYGSTHALLYLDLDQFKVVNDSCGHHVGDQMLQQVSSLLSNCIRTGDLVARLGGDEFGIVLDRCSIRHALAVAENICERLEDSRFHHGEVSFRLSASIGLVPIDRRWPDSAALMQAADACCYAAKDAGRNRVYAWHETDVTTAERHTEMQRVSQIERAIDDDRFELFAQRIVPVDDRMEDVHCEVLLRLRDIDGTIVPPGAFLPAAERYNLVGRVDRWVVRKVFDVLDGSNGANGVATIAVNLSGQSIGDRNFHRFLFDLVARATFDVSILCFEITETAAITHLADAVAFIDGMRRLGVRISLDDFGSGVSSFGYLKSLTVDYLKIDGQFIRELVDDPLDRATVRCFQEVARVVGVQTIAEWVEVAETRSVLREIGVDYIQGYLTHRPEPLVDVLAQADAVAIATVGCATLVW